MNETSLAGLKTYYRDVLGIDSFLMPENMPLQEPATAAGPAILVLSERKLADAELQMLDRMMAAIGQKDGYRLLELTAGELLPVLSDLMAAQAILIFSEELMKNCESHHLSNLYLSPSTKDMLTNAGLKKTAWEVLQKLQRSLQERL